MGCEKEGPDCTNRCLEFERIGGVPNKGGLNIRFVCGEEDEIPWDSFEKRKGRTEQSGH